MEQCGRGMSSGKNYKILNFEEDPQQKIRINFYTFQLSYSRDRNFRTFTSPIPTQFCGVTVDSSSTYVASGSVDTFNVYVWHLTSGRFLLEITGHEAPISAICFSPKQGSSMLATVSWDKTLRVRDFIEKESNTQIVQLEAEGIWIYSIFK